MQIQIANKELELDWIVELARYFTIRTSEEYEIFLRPDRESYTKDEVRRIAYLIGELAPDESSIDEGGEVRLWWD